MKRAKNLSTRDVIETVEVAAVPDRVLAALTGGELASWQLADGAVTFRGDIVGEHVVARMRVDAMTPAFIALACESTSVDVGWRDTRAHLALARTPRGTRVAVVHAGVPANGASHELWCGFLAELATIAA